MPFVASPPLMIGHMQADNDPVRASAEFVEPFMEEKLRDAWLNLGHNLPPIDGPDALQRVSAALSDAVRPVAQDLLLARSLGYSTTIRRISADTVRKDFTLSFHFDRVATAVQDQADQNAARFVREIGEDTRSTLANMLQDATARGLGPEELARTLKESVGLTTAQAKAVQNYRRLLETGSPEALTRALRDQRFDVEVERLAELQPSQIDARVEAYRRRYVAYRANTIARYETLFASNSGSITAVQSAIKTGALPPGTVKVWMIAKDEIVCKRCRSIPEMQPAGVGLHEAFRWQNGKRSGEIFLAPLHPDCRCTNAYRAQ